MNSDITVPASLMLRTQSIRLGAKVASGSCCEVYKGVCSDGKEVAVKVIPFRSEHPSLKAKYLKELECLRTVSGHNNIVKLIDSVEDERQGLGLIVEEFCSQGSLNQLCNRQELTENQVLTILKDIACALSHIHNRHIAHRDLRPRNILIGNDFRCRLADFSSATTTFFDALPEARVGEVQRDVEANTSPVFRAPEQTEIKPGTCINQMVDMWGLGCLIYGLLFRENAFSKRSVADHRIGQYKPPPKSVPEFWIRLFNILFVPNPHQRASAEDVLSLCIQSEIPKIITQSEAPPPPSMKGSSIVDLFKTSTTSWVRSATSNCDAPPDPHYVTKLLNKAWLKPFKICKFYGAVQRRPLYKTRVAIKALMLVHLYILHGPMEALIQIDGGPLRLLASMDQTWHPQSRVKFDELRCEYFAGLIRQYSKVLHMKLGNHRVSGLKGDWAGNGALSPNAMPGMLTYWSKLIHLSSGLLLDVSELPQLRASLAGLLMEEKLRLLRLLAGVLCSLIECGETTRALVPELLTRFHQNYQQTRTLAVTLKRIRPLLNFDIPSEDLPEDLARLVDSKAKRKKSEEGIPLPMTEEEQILDYIGSFQNSKPSTSSIQYRPTAPKLTSNYSSESMHSRPSYTHERRDFPKENPPFHSPKTNQVPHTDLLELELPEPPKSGIKSDLKRPIPGEIPRKPIPDDESGHIQGFNFTKKQSKNRATPYQSEKTPSNVVDFPLISTEEIPLKSIEFPSTGKDQALIPNVFQSMLMFPAPANQEEKKMDFAQEIIAKNAAWIIKLQDLQFGPTLGVGSSCQVFLGTYKGTPVAIKVMKTNLSTDLKREFTREIAALERMHHPNLVLFLGACVDRQMSIVTEFCAGETLFKLLHERKDVMLSWKQKAKMCRDVAHGMSYLHSSSPPIIHRDLKSLNLLLYQPVNGPNDKIEIKITDFGISKVMDHAMPMTGQMGTCHWMAPEVLASQTYGLPADVYSFGIVLWEIICRETPYRNLPPLAIADRVVRCGERPNLTVVPSSCPIPLKELMIKCWQTDPSKRPSFPEVVTVLDRLLI